ncbi:MAG: leucine-rich repeat protein, partial [Clostridium sp.]|nr:leucine-rich repeat protein [Clostridium sp.]
NVIIPKSVEYIGYQAFAYNNLTTVSFEASSKLKYMDSSTFWGNSNPINITLTTPTDLSNWPAGTNDNITVVYER